MKLLLIKSENESTLAIVQKVDKMCQSEKQDKAVPSIHTRKKCRSRNKFAIVNS